MPRLCAGGASLAPGRYPLPADMRDAFEDPDWGVADDGTFAFDERHAILLKHFNWRTEPLDGPYWPLPFVDGKLRYDDAHDAELAALHGHMLAALQVFLVHATLPPGCERSPDIHFG